MSASALLAVGLALAANTGCTRTSDGTILPAGYTWMRDRMPQPGTPRWRRQAEPEQTAANWPAPPPPQQTVRRRVPQSAAASVRRNPPRLAAVRIGVRAPFQQSQQGKQLNCRNEQTQSGRVKVVCD